jgi:hypothetical protein
LALQKFLARSKDFGRKTASIEQSLEPFENARLIVDDGNEWMKGGHNSTPVLRIISEATNILLPRATVNIVPWGNTTFIFLLTALVAAKS